MSDQNKLLSTKTSPSPPTMAFLSPPRRTSGVLRFIILVTGALILLFYARQIAHIARMNASLLSGHKSQIHLTYGQLEGPIAKPKTPPPHPIDELIEDADKVFDRLLEKRSHDLKTAAAEYRKRRGRHPPPGFDQWFEFANANGAVIVEDFFDQIYHDLAPFWGIAPSAMREQAVAYEMTINIRNHQATAESSWFWTQIWLDLIQTIQHLLPDMDIALNAMDEPRIVVPWEEMNLFMEAERVQRNMPPPKDIISEYGSLNPPVKKEKESTIIWEGGEIGSFWNIATRGCHPDSLARKAVVQTDFSYPPTITLEHTIPYTYKSFVSNYTASTDFCNQPDLQSLHGIMIKPLSISSTKEFFPMFGGSKLHTNNEILLPAPMYWNNEERFSGGYNHGPPWEQKMDKVIWRGVATGGHNQPDNWRGFQRHRFVAMTNGTTISAVERWLSFPENWALPSSQHGIAAQAENRLGEWTDEWADTGFVDLNCDPPGNLTCYYTSPYFSVMPGVMMAEQFKSKYLPDLDGNSFSGRYRGFLLSTSLPIKATIFREWHDCRLVPWKHFVPMDNRFIDFWGIMQYFLGYEGKNIRIEGHDDKAKKIAMDGQDWANQVLRKEDMQIYVLRVLLEYARLSDDRREKMGWADDLL